MQWQVKLVSVVVITFAIIFWHFYSINTAVTKAVQAQELIYKERLDQISIQNLKVESKLKTQVADITGEKDAKIKTIDAKYRNVLGSLLKYQTDSTGNSTRSSSNAESTEGTNAEGLFARHAEIALGVARDAEELKAQLNMCYTQYDSIKDSLNTLR